jgi:hypothetical protein
LLLKNIKIKPHRTLILPVILHECETWSLTLREEHRLRVFESRVLRKIFGPMRDEVTRQWRRPHNEKLYDIYPSPNIIQVIISRKMRQKGHKAHMGVRTGAYSVLVRGPEGKRSLGRPRCKRKNNIKMSLRAVEWRGLDWIDLAVDRDRKGALGECGTELSGFIKCGEFPG